MRARIHAGQTAAAPQPRFQRALRGTVGIVSTVLWLTALGASSVAAAAPSNDDHADARVVSELPYTDAVDTREATSEDIPGCFADEHSVWYRFTPARDMRFAVVLDADYDAAIQVMTGPKSSPTLVGCADDPEQLVVEAHAGTAYRIMVGSCCAASGTGTVVIRRVVPPAVDVRLTGAFAEDRTGEAIVVGSYRCGPARSGNLGPVTVRQRRPDDTITSGWSGGRQAACDGERHRFRRTVEGTYAFDPGWARVTVRLIACRPLICAVDRINAVVRIRSLD